MKLKYILVILGVAVPAVLSDLYQAAEPQDYALRYLKAKSAKESNRAEKLAISTGKSSSAEEEELDDSNSAELEETGSNSKSNSNSEDIETTGSSAELEETEDRFLRRRVLNSKSSRRSRHHHHSRRHRRRRRRNNCPRRCRGGNRQFHRRQCRNVGC